MINRIPFSNIAIHDGFWKTKQDMVRHTTAKAVYDRFAETFRFDALRCRWAEEGRYQGHIFWDSDVAKWLEGVSYLLAKEPDAQLERLASDAISDIIRNCDEDGYFNSYFLTVKQDQRFKHRGEHELYCAGHLIEAAIAWKEATGRTDFLDAMCKYADYIEQVFKVEQSAGFTTPGHPELELALMRLYHTTGERRYLELAAYFIDEHGVKDKGAFYEFATEQYNMDHIPLREANMAEGHCVRMLYLLCGMADVAMETKDEALMEACRRCFTNITQKRMYVTGGTGSTHEGESFTIDYDLPNRTAYAETCASIALALFSERMGRMENKSVYADTVERVIYNGVLSGISMDGKSFFYENPLEIDPGFNVINTATVRKERFPITERVEVFSCSCCPPNLVRFLASVGDYLYHYDDHVLYVNQYMASDAEYNGWRIVQETNYPIDGEIRISGKTDLSRIALRIPGWCKAFSLNLPYEMKNGYAYVIVEGAFDLQLRLSMSVVLVQSNPRVHENAGRLAVTRGPIVYCLEGVDNGNDLKTVSIKKGEPFNLIDADFLVPSLETKGYRPKKTEELYSDADAEKDEITLKFIPYFAFANRGTSEMLVWILRDYL